MIEDYIQQTNPLVKFLVKVYETTDDYSNIACIITAQCEEDSGILIDYVDEIISWLEEQKKLLKDLVE